MAAVLEVVLSGADGGGAGGGGGDCACSVQRSVRSVHVCVV